MDAGGEGVGDEGGLNAAQRSLDGTIDLAQLDLPAHLMAATLRWILRTLAFLLRRSPDFLARLQSSHF